MSEELLQRYPLGKGKKIGRYELFQTQTTTINQYALNGIIPNKDYGEYKDQKPDELIVRRVPAPTVVAVGEMKKPGEITEKNFLTLAEGLLFKKCKPLNASIGYLSDGIQTYWINGAAGVVTQIQREDEESMPRILDFNDKAFVTELNYIIEYFDPSLNLVRSKESKNPHKLANEVWQSLWRLRADRPEDCLAAFVELFIFKFLDDLGLLRGTNSEGESVSLKAVMAREKEKSFNYYKKNVRPYIQELFKTGDDGYGMIIGNILQENNRDHNIIFYEIMKKFEKFGTLRNTAPEFKTKLYESFLQESRTTSTFGQFFTPRKIVEIIYRMAKINEALPGSIIYDPACGVGGFILEQMALDLSGEWELKNNAMKPLHKWKGHDIVPKTIMLAKANALVHCGELLADQPERVKSFAKWCNETFSCQDKTALGSLEFMYKNKIDYIITNPPYVVSGSTDISKIVKSDNKRALYYGRKYSGVEGLFVQFIIQSLKKNGHAWVLLPESFFLRGTDCELRDWMLKNCSIDLMAILPENTFYNTPKRVVIVHLKKRIKELSADNVNSTLREERTLIFVVSEIGETRDAKRFPCESDLELLADIYQKHIANVDVEELTKRAKVVTSLELYGNLCLNLRHFYDKNIALELDLIATTTNSVDKLKNIQNKSEEIQKVIQDLNENKTFIEEPLDPQKFTTVKLGNVELFKLKIGKRVLKKDIYQNEANIPLYSANIRSPFGFVHVQNAGGLEYGGALWSIDSDFDCKGVTAGDIYSITDHCGEITILNERIDPNYLAMEIKRVGLELGFNREYRPSLRVMEELEVDLPITEAGDFDYELMRQWAVYDGEVEFYKEQLIKIMNDLK